MSPPQQAGQSISILAKTQNYLQDKRKRSQSQPPPDDKRTKRKFDFLSTANFNPRQARKADRDVEKSDNSSALKLSFEKNTAAQHIENSSRANSKKDERQKLIKTPQFCSFQKFEFALQSHRRFVQTLVWELSNF